MVGGADVRCGCDRAHRHLPREAGHRRHDRETLLAELAAATRDEAGCLLYLVNRSTTAADTFVLYEHYVDEAALAAHRDSPHFQRLGVGQVIPMLEERVFDVYRGEQAGPGKKSIALAAAFQSPERTLSDEDAAAMDVVQADRARALMRNAAGEESCCAHDSPRATIAW